jgi:beta-N-acetylhexosaminidase
MTVYNRNILKIEFIFLLLFSMLPGYAQDELDQKIGQMIMVSWSPWRDGALDTLYYDIAQRNLGGILLFAYHINDPVQIRDLTDELQKRSTVPLLIATDQEGGLVARLDENNGFEETRTAYQLGTVIDNEDSTRRQARMMAGWLYDCEINTNLAPVVDVNVNPLSPAIGYYGRSFSADPLKVFQHASWFISEFNYFNIVSTLKHFPGHGSAIQDSHLGFTDITNTWADSELVPYRELISTGYNDMIMTGHLYNAQLDSVYPASLSKNVITGILRDSLGFEGVVISDELFMGAITANYSFEEAIVLAINAGTDILLYRDNYYNGVSLVAEAVRIIRKNIDQGDIALSKIEASYEKIMALKTRITGLAARPRPPVPQTCTLAIYPNPFNLSTTIEVNIGKAGPAEMEIYDLQGRRIRYHRYAWMEAGRHIITFDAKNLSSGLYFVKFEIDGLTLARKLTLIK